MSPRPYKLGQRQDQIDQSRRRVLDCARTLLGEASSYTAFTVDAVAKQADVARATVYYQFGSKSGLLEAVCDDLAQAGQLSELAQAFANPDNAEALAGFVACFGRFWDADRTIMRRLRALAALDPDVAAVIAARDQRRRQGLDALVSRGTGRAVPPTGPGHDRIVRTLLALTSFETFDTLAAADQALLDVVPEIVALAEAVLEQTHDPPSA